MCIRDRITDDVLKGIESLNPLAPLHNPAHVQGIRACQDVFGTEVPQVAVFDTAFHSTMPPKAYTFAIPYEYYEKYAVRRYGFHGTSHKMCIRDRHREEESTQYWLYHPLFDVQSRIEETE